MKKTFDSHIFYYGQLRVCDAESGINAHEKDDPACGKLRLDVERLMEAANNSLHKAREKHPDFVPLPGPECASMYATRALFAKNDIESRVATGYGELPAVLFSEVYEFLAEVANGDFDRDLEEAGDVVAVLYRALNNEGKKKEEDK